MFMNALAVCAAIATFVGGAHVSYTYLNKVLDDKVKSVVSADANTVPTIEMMPEPALPAKKK
jgi:hypothetical protein